MRFILHDRLPTLLTREARAEKLHPLPIHRFVSEELTSLTKITKIREKSCSKQPNFVAFIPLAKDLRVLRSPRANLILFEKSEK